MVFLITTPLLKTNETICSVNYIQFIEFIGRNNSFLCCLYTVEIPVEHPVRFFERFMSKYPLIDIFVKLSGTYLGGNCSEVLAVRQNSCSS
jgi:hypothetical protein